MNKTLHALLFAFIALGSTALVAQTSALSVEKIMQDPKWMGTFPDRINWGPQSKTIYFNYNPEENPSDSLYKIEVSNLDEIQKVSLAERKAMTSAYGTWNQDETKKLYSEDGALLL